MPLTKSSVWRPANENCRAETDLMNFDKLLAEVFGQSKELGKTLFKQYRTQASDDARDFLEKSRESLKRAADLLAEGKIDADDFEILCAASGISPRCAR